MLAFILSLACILLASALFFRRYHGTKQPPRLPPGPFRLPLVGNLFNAPTDFAWKTYDQWSRKYGIIFHPKYSMFGFNWPQVQIFCT
jgi:hypothetical protein